MAFSIDADRLVSSMVALLVMAVALVCAPQTAIAREAQAQPETKPGIRSGDFGVMWWNKPIKKVASTEKSMRLNIRTGNYGLQLNPYAADLCRLGFVRGVSTREDVMKGSDDTVNGLPEVSSKVWVETGGKVCAFASSRAMGPMGVSETQQIDSMWRVLESGHLSQRFDMANIRYSGTGAKLRGRLEIQSLPSFLNIRYEVTPMQSLPGDSTVAWSLKLPESWSAVEWLNGDASSGALTLSDATGNGASLIVHSGTGGTLDMSLSGSVITFSLTGVKLESGTPWYDARYGFSVTIIPSGKASNADIREYQAIRSVGVSCEAIAPAEEPKTTYDASLGMHEVSLGAFTAGYGRPGVGELDTMERCRVALRNPTDTDLFVPVVFTKPRDTISYVTGYVAMLRDADTGEPTGIPVQLSKNWHTRPGVPMLFDGAWARSTAIIRVPAKSKVEYELTVAIQNWGGLPTASVAQLCLVGWGTNGLWIESALGSNGESICFEPDGTQMPDGSMIDDIRPLQVAGMGGSSGRPGSWDSMAKYTWTTNVGGGNFMALYNATKAVQYQSSVKTDFVRYGPNLTELNFNYKIGADDAVSADVRAYLTRTDDLLRVIYKLRYDVRKDISYTRLAFFQLGSDSYAASEAGKLAFGSAEGLGATFPAAPAKNAYVTGRVGIEIPGKDPWVCLYEESAKKPSETGATGNRGFIVRSWAAQLGGKAVANPHFSVHNTTGWPTKAAAPQWELSPAAASGTLKAGDYVDATIEMIVLPQYTADYYGTSAYLATLLGAGENSWEPFQRYAADNRLSIEVTRGGLAREVPTSISVDAGQSAEFSIAGGIGYVPVTITGLARAAGYVLEVLRGDSWVPFSQAVWGNDFWQSDYDKSTGGFSRTYNLNRTEGPATLPRTYYRLRDGSNGLGW